MNFKQLTFRYNVHLGVFNTPPVGIPTGNVVQQTLKNLENSRPPKNVEIPVTKIYNAMFDLSHHEGIEFFKRIPNVNQYEQLHQVSYLFSKTIWDGMIISLLLLFILLS